MFVILKKTVFLILFSISGLVSQSAADAYDIYFDSQNSGVKAAAMGGAFGAVADDYGAVLVNPAGLTRNRKISLHLSGRYNNREINSDYLDSQSAVRDNSAGLSGVTLIFPYPVYRGSFVLALGYEEIKNYDRKSAINAFDTLANEYEIQYQYLDGTVVPPFYMKDVQRLEDISQQGGLDAWSAAAAIDLAENFSAGLTLIYLHGRLDYKNSYGQYDIHNFYNDASLGQDVDIVGGVREDHYALSGWEANAGFLYAFSPTFRLGFNARIPFSFEVSEDYTDLMTIRFDDPEDQPIRDYPRDEFKGSYGYRFPFTFSLSAAKRWNNLLLSVQADYQDWSLLTVTGGGDLDDALETVFFWRGGAEYGFADRFFIRAGYYYAASPEKNPEEFPARRIYSGGIAWKFGEVSAMNISAIYHETDRVSPGDDIMPANAILSETDLTVRLDFQYSF
jgi:long-subunit fatty acid transport protein